MKKRVFLSFIAASTLLHATEFRFGASTFNWQMSMPFMNMDIDIDANVYSINQVHKNLVGSPFYYFYNIDIYQSDYMDAMTTFITQPLTYDFPVFGSFNDAVDKYTSIPVPADYKIRGFDINLGIGYDILANEQGRIGLGINTGLSIPVMKMRNLQSDAKLTYDLLDSTETKISTYKLGPILHGLYKPNKQLLLYGSFTMGVQTGSIENDWVKSSFDVDGGYTFLDLGLRYTPWQMEQDFGWISLSPQLFVTIGYSYKKWEMDDVTLDAFNIAQFNSGGLFTSSFDTNYLYFGIGYDF